MPTTFQDRYGPYFAATHTDIDLDPLRTSIGITADGLCSRNLSIDTTTATFQTALSDKIEKLVKQTVKQYLEEEGFILGRLPDEKEAEKAFDRIFESTDE